jgi:hypothetical protein
MSSRVEAFAENNGPSLFGQVVQGVFLLVLALVMSACSKAPPTPPVPDSTATQNETMPARGGSSDTSVPDAGSVLSPSAEPKVDPAAERTNKAMTRGQESSAMPMPGQNNDHSAPAAPARRASSP